MGFPEKVAEEVLVSSARHCCLCHKFCGVKIELHHIKQKADGGEDTLENCIPLCFDCHSEVKAYNPKHPKGSMYTETELMQHRDIWYNKVKMNIGINSDDKFIKQDKGAFEKINLIFGNETMDYQLQMKVGKKFIDSNFWVQYSLYYNEPNTKDLKRIDIVSTYTDLTGLLNISFVCECKSSLDKPFIVLTSSNVLDNRNRLFSFSYNSKFVKTAFMENIERLDELQWFFKKNRVGYDIVQSFNDIHEGQTYYSIRNVLKASEYFFSEYQQKGLDKLNFVFPTIIIEGNLFECYLDEKNEIYYNEISQCFLLNDLINMKEIVPCINVININYIDSFISEANKEIITIESLCKEKIKGFLDNLKLIQDLLGSLW